jgi:histidinol-phosphatase (PHP family)
MQDYVEQAIRLGLEEIGFADHLPLVSHRDPELTMGEEELPRYVEEVIQLRAQYPSIPIRLGIEADFLPGWEEKTAALLEPYPWDYVIGSVHILTGWEFDNPKRIEEWDKRDVDEVYHLYFDTLRRSAECGMFDIIGHSDLVKKFGHRPSKDFSGEIEEAAEAFRQAGVAVELNTSGLRKPVGEMYPSVDILKVFGQKNLPLVISSDSHKPEEAGMDFDKAGQLARQVGFTETVLFQGRERVGSLPLPE